MCGIVGVAGNLEHKDLDVFKELLYVDWLRGKAATGIGAVGLNKEFEIFKRASDPSELMLFTKFHSLLNQGKKMLLGHNRAPTMGANNKFNAHPFEFRKIMGVHNGTLDRACLKDLDHSDWFDTDSEQLYFNIDQHGVKEAISRASGAWSLVYYDGEDHTINFLRNEERPMFYVFSKDRRRMFWASELWMLRGILHRNGIALEDNFYETNPDVHYSWTIPHHGQIFGDARRFQCKGKEKPSVYTGGSRGYANGYGAGWDWREEQRKREEREKRVAEEAEARKKAEEEGKQEAKEDKVVVPFVMQEQEPRQLLLPQLSGSSSNNSTSGTSSTGVGGLIKPTVTVEQQLSPNRIERHHEDSIRKVLKGQWKPPYFDKNGGILPKFKWNLAVQDGCVNCSHVPTWGDYCRFGPDLDVKSGSKVFVCETCALEPEIVQIAMNS